MKRLGLCVLTMTSLLGGCAGNGSADFDPLPDDVCAKQHRATTSEGDEVVVCDALYSKAPFVHLPKLSSDRTFAGIVNQTFVTPAGVSVTGGQGLESEMKRHAVALYELALDAGKVDDFQPVILFDESLFFAPLMGQSFEGTISRSIGNGRWADDASLPVRLTVAAEPANPLLAGDTFEAEASIANLSASVTAGDGSCMPSLASYGSEAPFAAGASVDLRLLRVPSMHDFGDDHFVVNLTVDGEPAGNLMGPSWYRSPLDLVNGTLSPTEEYQGVGHGSPGSIPSITLEPGAASGGEACDP